MTKLPKLQNLMLKIPLQCNFVRKFEYVMYTRTRDIHEMAKEDRGGGRAVYNIRYFVLYLFFYHYLNEVIMGYNMQTVGYQIYLPNTLSRISKYVCRKCLLPTLYLCNYSSSSMSKS